MMNTFLRKQKTIRDGFSLVEVILAVGIFAFSILAIVAMLGATSQSASEVLDTATASRIADGVRSELDGVPVASLVGLTSSYTNPLKLFATRNGERVRLENDVNNGPETGDPPGIAATAQYYRIEVVQLEHSLAYDNGSATMPVSVRVIWPHHLPRGPNDPIPVVVTPERQSMAIFNTAILRKE